MNTFLFGKDATMPAVKGMTAYQFARMNEIERMPKQQPDTLNEVKKNVGNQLTNASVGAFVGARESFDIVQNYMDAAVGVVGQVANGTINDPIKSKYAFPNPFVDFAEGVKNIASGSNLRAPTMALDGKNFFDMQGVMLDGKKVRKMREICQGKKAVLVVNVASNCTLTAQNYEGLVDLYRQYKSKGL